MQFALSPHNVNAILLNHRDLYSPWFLEGITKGWHYYWCQENIADGALLTDFFDGLEDVDCSAELGSDGQNADFSTYGLASTGNVVGHDDFDFMELIDLDSDTFWQTQPESWSRNK